MRVAIIGSSGYWGQKLDRVAQKLGWYIERYGRANISALSDTDADAAIIATPPDTHFGLAKRCLRLGMDLFIEKPMCLQSDQVYELMQLAQKHGAVIFVDSTFLYTESFHALRRLDTPIISYQSQRLMPPLPSSIINAGWDMIWHDLAILDGLDALIVGEGMGAVDSSMATAALPTADGSAFIMASRCWPGKIREIVIHAVSGVYSWNLAGVREINSNNYLAKESMETLESALTQFEICCKDRILAHMTDAKHALRVTKALEHLFPRISAAQEPCFNLKKSLAN